jgi:N-acetyl sugar amidotransferase
MKYWDNKYTVALHKHPHQECVQCVMNTSDPLIEFNENGICNHCRGAHERLSALPSLVDRNRMLDNLVARLKASGARNDYDCIMGLSGGVDSSYLTWLAVKELGLRPLVVHVDTGWNSEIAVSNIQNLVQNLDLDLHTVVIDWSEMRDLQRSYFLSGVANLDVPQDHAFIATLYMVAERFGIKDILNGSNLQTESILPHSWEYDASDAKNLLSIHKHYGRKELQKYPVISLLKKYFYYPLIKGMKVHRPLNLFEYNKFDAKEILISKIGWRDYGGKHYESIFTRFHQAHYLPIKFGYDKRLAHFSSLISSGQMSREKAKLELEKPLYDFQQLENDKNFFIKKLGITSDEYENVMSSPPNFYHHFENNHKVFQKISSYKKHFVFFGGSD